mmetsp:Transcript_9645/g.27275  ORF Transcript_9645/g.27275 Transcript_9645/m.27275 type:complete len:259 (+) Transcript_9645:1028-1804(+)
MRCLLCELAGLRHLSGTGQSRKRDVRAGRAVYDHTGSRAESGLPAGLKVGSAGDHLNHLGGSQVLWHTLLVVRAVVLRLHGRALALERAERLVAERERVRFPVEPGVRQEQKEVHDEVDNRHGDPDAVQGQAEMGCNKPNDRHAKHPEREYHGDTHLGLKGQRSHDASVHSKNAVQAEKHGHQKPNLVAERQDLGVGGELRPDPAAGNEDEDGVAKDGHDTEPRPPSRKLLGSRHVAGGEVRPKASCHADSKSLRNHV